MIKKIFYSFVIFFIFFTQVFFFSNFHLTRYLNFILIFPLFFIVKKNNFFLFVTIFLGGIILDAAQNFSAGFFTIHLLLLVTFFYYLANIFNLKNFTSLIFYSFLFFSGYLLFSLLLTKIFVLLNWAAPVILMNKNFYFYSLYFVVTNLFLSCLLFVFDHFYSHKNRSLNKPTF